MVNPGKTTALVLRHLLWFGPYSLQNFETLTVDGLVINVDGALASLYLCGYVSSSRERGDVITTEGEKFLDENGGWKAKPSLQEFNQRLAEEFERTVLNGPMHPMLDDLRARAIALKGKGYVEELADKISHFHRVAHGRANPRPRVNVQGTRSGRFQSTERNVVNLTRHTFTVNDCALLWDLGVRVDDDMRG